MFLPFFLFITTFAIYLHNLSSSVYGGDVGDFITAAVVRGVPHPSGYPLFTLLGILFNSLPINQTPAFKMGLISVVASSFSVVLMYLIVLELTKRKLLGFITALTLAFIYPFWLYAELAEVFALNSFFMLLLLFLAVLYHRRKKLIFLYILSFSIGLSLTHHEIIVLLFPSILFLILTANWRIILKFSILARCALLFLLGLLPYAYIPIAAFYNPPLNWGNAVTPENFFRLILRLDYGWVLDTTKIDWYFRFLTIKAYFAYWKAELPPVLIGSCILGAIYMIKKGQKLLFFSIFLAFFLTGVFFAWYSSTSISHPFGFGVIERFYMVSFPFFVLFFPFGILFITESVIRILGHVNPIFLKRSFYSTIFSVVFIAIPIFLFFYNFPKTDLHDVWTGDYLGEDVLLPLPKNSILLLNADTILLNTFYMHYARNTRKDVEIYTSSLLDVQISKNNYLRKRKEEILKKNISNEQANLLAIASLVDERPIFSNEEIPYNAWIKGKELAWMPYGLVFKLIDSSNGKKSKTDFLDQQEKILSSLHFSELKKEKAAIKRSLTLSHIPEIYALALVNTANYLVSNYNDRETAKAYYEKSLSVYPAMKIGYEELGMYYFNKKECKKAEELFNRLISLNEKNKNGYVLLYFTYNDCYKDKKKADSIARKFKLLFSDSIKNYVSKQ